ncbi:hypothetical protein [Tumebacillus permanentifrigoris]|uniref:Uncharacterized protein n=1 Tax=Tumebacillus permanentifrigoris TaxID=378543 RepID=A0A316D245_9BACL|nr:hypothetical protein [Tumebacillus permanentifrigoris]PWK03949.1 hypothetical protein C7459_1385 [Tumebacillus permanentifrigoris]
MKRTIYVAGVNRKHLAAAASSCRFWLLSVTLIRKRGGEIPDWLRPYHADPERRFRFDPGTFSEGPVSYQTYRLFLDRWCRPQDDYLQYDEIGDPEATAWYLKDMRRRGYDPIPVLQPGGDTILLREPKVAIGGLLSLREEVRMLYLDRLLHGPNKPAGEVQLLGIGKQDWYERYDVATSGDCTSWIPRSEWNRRKSIEQWMEHFGEVEIPHAPLMTLQQSLF